MQPGWLQLKDSHTLALTFGIDWQGGSHGRSSYWVKTRRMGHRRGKWGSRQCGPLGRHIEKTSQGNKSQNGIQHQWGVTRPQLILALVSAYIRRTRSTFPSSGCSISMLMLVKWLWCGRQNSCSGDFFPRQIIQDEPRAEDGVHSLWAGSFGGSPLKKANDFRGLAPNCIREA